MDNGNSEDWLDRQLREAKPYIDDGGFAARGMSQLPPRRRHSQSLRAVILLGMTILASGLSFFLSGNARFIALNVEKVATLPMLWIFILALSCGLLVTGAGLVAALSKSRELQSY